MGLVERWAALAFEGRVPIAFAQHLFDLLMIALPLLAILTMAVASMRSRPPGAVSSSARSPAQPVTMVSVRICAPAANARTTSRRA